MSVGMYCGDENQPGTICDRSLFLSPPTGYHVLCGLFIDVHALSGLICEMRGVSCVIYLLLTTYYFSVEDEIYRSNILALPACLPAFLRDCSALSILQDFQLAAHTRGSRAACIPYDLPYLATFLSYLPTFLRNLHFLLQYRP